MKQYRKPTYEEICKRVEQFRFWLGVFVYVLIGLGGNSLFMKYVHDPAWQEIFLSVWWLPSGAISWWLALYSTLWITAFVEEDEAEE